MEFPQTRWRKKPVEVDACHFIPDYEHLGFLVAWLDTVLPNNLQGVECEWALTGIPGKGMRLQIKTLEGTMEATPGDWIIRGVKGELYPCKPDVFAETYEPADKNEKMVKAIVEAETEEWEVSTSFLDPFEAPETVSDLEVSDYLMVPDEKSQALLENNDLLAVEIGDPDHDEASEKVVESIIREDGWKIPDLSGKNV